MHLRFHTTPEFNAQASIDNCIEKFETGSNAPGLAFVS
jgi:hypothetical protein